MPSVIVWNVDAVVRRRGAAGAMTAIAIAAIVTKFLPGSVHRDPGPVHFRVSGLRTRAGDTRQLSPLVFGHDELVKRMRGRKRSEEVLRIIINLAERVGHLPRR